MVFANVFFTFSAPFPCLAPHSRSPQSSETKRNSGGSSWLNSSTGKKQREIFKVTFMFYVCTAMVVRTVAPFGKKEELLVRPFINCFQDESCYIQGCFVLLFASFLHTYFCYRVTFVLSNKVKQNMAALGLENQVRFCKKNASFLHNLSLFLPCGEK